MRLREQAASGKTSSGCMGLLYLRREEAVSGGAPAARGCSLVQGRSLSLGRPPLHGAACFLTPFLLPVSFRICRVWDYIVDESAGHVVDKARMSRRLRPVTADVQ